MNLRDGLQLRVAEPRDLAQIGELLAARGEPEDAVDHRLLVEDPDGGYGWCAVVVDDDRVVSTATLLDERVRFGDVALPAGQVELVATDPDYEGRGLVRALMHWAHQRSADAGHILQVMIGIPYFYRLFGYRYAIGIPATRRLRVAALPDSPGDVTARRATPGDLPALARLHDHQQRSVDLAMPHSPVVWRAVLARQGSEQWVAERGGELVGAVRGADDDDVRAAELAAADVGVLAALLRATSAVTATERPNTPVGELIEPFLESRPTAAERFYVRIPDPLVLLDALRPVFAGRLAGHDDAEIVVSFFGSHVRAPWRGGSLGQFQPGGAMQGPGRVGGAGVAPDHLADLLFGPHGVVGLSEIHPDVYPGPNRGLMAVLFPPVTSDLMTFYLP